MLINLWKTFISRKLLFYKGWVYYYNMSKKILHSGQKTKSAKQVRYLLSSGSPLSSEGKDKLKKELKTRKVKIRK